jgi:hypothetical protein
MKEKLGAALAATSVLIAGCATESAPTPKTIVIDSTAIFPEALPLAVSQQLGNVAAIQSLRLPTNQHTKIDAASACTGVRIDQYEFLTTGSCDEELGATDQFKDCDVMGMSIGMPGQAPTDPPKGVTYLYAKKNGVIPAPGITDITKMTENWSVGQIDASSQPLPAYDHPTHFAPPAVQVPVGTQLYTASYEKTADGKMRNPDPKHAHSTPDQVKAGLANETTMGAIALSQTPNGTVEVLTIKSYDDSKDAQLHSGSSGSPVWTADGTLVGIISSANTTHKISEFKKEMHIGLPGISDDAVASVGVVQLINPPRICDLQAHEIPTQKC